ncbi:MAG: hypothetical protein EXR45_01480 [Chloroflexi bacterium]|nr:hypothetical protein [Chloroflexota bacterium]
MIVAIWWWLVVQVISIATLPASFRFFHPFADRGYALNKTVALVAFGFVSWWLGVTGLLENQASTSLIVIVALGAGSWWSAGNLRRDLQVFMARRQGLLLLQEAIFAIAFVGFLLIRSHAADIAGTEKFMDFAFLNSVARSAYFPPIDPWLSPASGMPNPTVNYYYFGYLVHGLLIQLAGVLPGEGFNLALATVFALAAVGIFSVGYTPTRDIAGGWSRSNLIVRTRTELPRGGWALDAAWPYVVAGLGSVFMVLIGGNLWTVLRRIDGSGMWQKDFWGGIGWNATRVLVIRDGDRDIDYTINEFPAFSFLLGDLHPHVMALPFTVLAVGIAYRWLVHPPVLFRWATGVSVAGRGVPSRSGLGVPGAGAGPEMPPWRQAFARLNPIWEVLPVAALVAVLYFANSWDFPAYFLLICAAGIVGAWPRHADADETGPGTSPFRIIFRTMCVVTGTAVLSGLLVFPFLASFTPPVVSGPGEMPIGFVSQRSLLSQFIQFWGLQIAWVVPPLWIVGKNIAGSVRQGIRSYAVPIGSAVLVGLIAVLELRGAGTYALAVTLAGLSIYGALQAVFPAAPRSGGGDNQSTTQGDVVPEALRGGRGLGFALAILGTAFALLAVCEVFYIRDFYGGSLRRMNTVFKLYYQSWLMIGVAGGPLAYWVIRQTSESAGEVARAGSYLLWRLVVPAMMAFGIVIIGGMLVYPLKVTGLRTNAFANEPVLDGMDWMRKFHPEDYAAARWLCENGVEGSGTRAPVILEASGGPYSEYARFSTQSGFPTVLGWDQHERLWRGDRINAEIDRRKRDVELVYRSQSATEARQVLETYGVTYLVVGYLERQAYGGPGLSKFDQPELGLTQVFREGQTTVYATGIPPLSRDAANGQVPAVQNSK